MERVGSLVRLWNGSADSLTEKLIVVTTHDAPFVNVEESPDGNFTFTGYLVDVWDNICQELNVTYQILPPINTGFGTLHPNGSWTGMVAELAEQRADVVLSWLFYREDRATVVEYADMVPVFTGGYQFYMRAGGHEVVQLNGNMFNSLLRPLHTYVWLTLRMLISMNYTANLISYLTVRHQEPPIKTLEDFVSRQDWTLALEKGVGVLGDWANSSSPAERQMYKRAIEGDRILWLDGTDDNMRLATAPNTIVYYNSEIIHYRIQDDACELIALPTASRWVSNMQYLVMRKGKRKLKRRVNEVLQSMWQAGTLGRLRTKWFGHGSHMCGGELASVRALTLADLLAVLVITPLAAAVSCLLLAAEVLVRRLVLRAGSGHHTAGRRRQLPPAGC